MNSLRSLVLTATTAVTLVVATTADAITVVAAQTATDAAGPRDGHVTSPAPTKGTPCSGLVVFGFQKSYQLQDLGVDASGSKPVSQDMLLVKCGNFAVDVWTSVQLSDDTYGHRGGGDEWDLEVSYADTVATPLGMFNYDVYAAYFALDLGEGLRDSSDDYVQVYGEIARTFQLRRVNVTPFARYIHLFAVGDGFADLDFIRTGVRFDAPFAVPLVGDVQGRLDASHVSNLDGSGAVPHSEVWRGELTLTRDLGLGWSVTIGAKFTEFVGTTPLIKFGYSF